MGEQVKRISVETEENGVPLCLTLSKGFVKFSAGTHVMVVEGEHANGFYALVKAAAVFIKEQK